MSKESVIDLVEIVKPYLHGHQAHAIPKEFQVLVALRFYTDGSYQKSVAQDCLHPVSQPMVSKILDKVTFGLCSLAEKFIRFPQTRNERLEISEK